MQFKHFPKQQGLYYPQYEKDACGVGFVCDVKGRASNTIIKQSLEVLNRLAHRGAVGSDPATGDGAGILLQMPDEFLRKVAPDSKIDLPEKDSYGAGLIFLPTDKKERLICEEVFAKAISECKQTLLGWRQVPLDNSTIGVTAREC